MLMHLKDASPWLRFIGILSFIGAGVMIFFGIIIVVAFPLLAVASGMENLFLGLMGSGMGIIYLAIGTILFFPALFTYNFGAKILSYTQSNNAKDLELAFKNNKSLWKFCGILCIIHIAFIPVGIIITVISVIGVGIF
jgi:hypothetical protein